MARFSYYCKACHKDFQKSFAMREPYAACPTCQTLSGNIMKIGSAVAYEHLDNGAMTRAIERPAEIEDMMESHAEAGPPPPPQPDEEDDPDPLGD